MALGQDSRQEIVAEFSAQVLCQMVGVSLESTIGNSYEYIRNYAEIRQVSLEKACLQAVADVEKCLKLILE